MGQDKGMGTRVRTDTQARSQALTQTDGIFAHKKSKLLFLA